MEKTRSVFLNLKSGNLDFLRDLTHPEFAPRSTESVHLRGDVHRRPFWLWGTGSTGNDTGSEVGMSAPPRRVVLRTTRHKGTGSGWVPVSPVGPPRSVSSLQWVSRPGLPGRPGFPRRLPHRKSGRPKERPRPGPVGQETGSSWVPTTPRPLRVSRTSGQCSGPRTEQDYNRRPGAPRRLSKSKESLLLITTEI